MTHVELLPQGQPLKLGRYQLIGRLASGGMGSVYLARIGGVGGFQRFVAIKRLHPHLAQQPEFVEMFLDEARLAASIHHQNVVPILEIGTSDAGYYLVMDYVEGESLMHVFALAHSRKEMLPRAVLVRILLDTLAGLHAAHELTDEEGKPLGLVHRDCSPQNVLVGIDGHSRLTDFGVARASARLATTREGTMKGKLGYMAPEQTQGDDLDRRADLFSVGVILWEGLTSRRLFKARSEAETLKRLLMSPVPSVREVVGEVPPALDAMCLKALQRDPAQRFQTASEMADALEQAVRSDLNDVAAEIATVRDVAKYMSTVLGSEISTQRESVRSWLSQTPTRVTGETLDSSDFLDVEDLSSLSSRRAPVLPDDGDDDPTMVRAPVVGAAVTTPSGPSPVARRRARLRWLVAAIVLLLVAVVVVGLWRQRGAPPIASSGPTSVPTHPPSGAQQAPTDGSGAALASANVQVDAGPSTAAGGASSTPVVGPVAPATTAGTASSPPPPSAGAPTTTTTPGSGNLTDLSNPYR